MLFIISLALVPALIFAAKENKTAELVADKTNFNFQTTREGIDVPVSFTLTNVGTGVVQIKNVLKSAGCLAPEKLTKNSLAPGESIKLEYLFRTTGSGGKTVNKWIHINYNNPRLSPLELTVTGKVLPVEPYQAPLGELLFNFYILVDIQSPVEFAQEHFIGAVNIPNKQLGQWASNLPADIKKNVLIYLCSKDGTQSDQAAQTLRKKGLKNCLSLVGGLQEWKKQYQQKLLVSGKW